MASTTPFSTAGMYCRGMAPPTTLSMKRNPAPRSRGSMRIDTTPNWPWPPVCFLYFPSASAPVVIVSRNGMSTSSISTSTPNFRAEALPGHRQVRLTRAPEDGLVGLVHPLDHQDRVLLLEAVEADHQLVLVALRLRPQADREHRRLVGWQWEEHGGALGVPACRRC